MLLVVLDCGRRGDVLTVWKLCTDGWFPEAFRLSDSHLWKTNCPESGEAPSFYYTQRWINRLQTHSFNYLLFFNFQVNQKGSEKPLEQTFAKMSSGLGNGFLK